MKIGLFIGYIIIIFISQIVGEVLHGFITGVSSTRSGTMVEKIELVFTRPNENKVGFNFKAVINGRCVDGSVFNNNEFDLIEGGRAEFKVPATGGVYSVLFSSNPESYVWNLLCFGGQVDGIPRCRAEDLLVTLYTLENPPNNINLEMMGRDLRLRTCLSMQEITDVYMFTFIQGNNTCPDNGV